MDTTMIEFKKQNDVDGKRSVPVEFWLEQDGDGFSIGMTEEGHYAGDANSFCSIDLTTEDAVQLRDFLNERLETKTVYDPEPAVKLPSFPRFDL